ncbi:Early 35 kDa protein [Gossypium arboreum]|uniref:Early 35 kDa protein n=1 Tax=Gossypium arboreum TaxID=29729 RepID=A0A0B0NVX5_GOSAR|nr:Early 35 kDa protein [Gossypium arboreum]
MYEIREWKMDHSKLLCNHVPKKHTCYSRILKSHPSSDCNFSYSYQGYPMPRLSRLWDIPWRDIPVWGLSVRGLGLGFEA